MIRRKTIISNVANGKSNLEFYKVIQKRISKTMFLANFKAFLLFRKFIIQLRLS